MHIYSKKTSEIMPIVQKTEYLVGYDLLANLHQITNISMGNYNRFLVISDENVFRLYGKKIIRSLSHLEKDIVISLIPSGERSKDFRLLIKYIKPYFQKSFVRKSCLISFGGGVVTDTGGFLASILLRGMANINIPTTLLGQVDAAIGGKSGVDLWMSENQMYKNMIGKIEQPKAVISDVEVLKTLPDKEILNGLGEIVKYWLGWGKPDLNQIFNIKYQKEKEKLCEIIEICQKIKINLVQKDPYETKGERQKLNFGHTIGHAIEGACNGQLSHGEAVSIGLIAAAKISLLMSILSSVKYRQIVAAVKSLGLPINIPKINMESVLSALHYDKKGGNFVLMRDIGKIETNHRVPEEYIRLALKGIIL